jgi:beta-lactam-binding protein with PASTA domain
MLDRRGHAHLTSRLAAVVAMAGTVCLVVSGGSFAGDAVVPDVVGMNVVSAYDAVHEAGFAVQIDEPIELDAIVNHQSRGSGTIGRAGSPVALDLDAHPMVGRWPPGGWTPHMPRLVGKPLPDAIQTLQALGLLWAVAPLPALPATLRPSLFDNYRVSAQRPAPGTEYTQTVVREIPGGLSTKTTKVGLMTELRLNQRRAD